MDYRRAKIPRDPNSMDEDKVGDEDEDEDDDVDYDDYDIKCWPERAFHAEGYFEYTFDLGRHGLSWYCHAFIVHSMTTFSSAILLQRKP